MIYFILKKTISEESLNYQINFTNPISRKNAKEFNCSNAMNNYAFSPLDKRSRAIEQPKGVKMAPLPAPAGRDGYGCDSVVVSIEACGALGPGSNPGRGPLTMEAN